MNVLSKISYSLLPMLALTSVSLNAATSTFSADQKKEIQEIVHQYLVEKPEVLVEAFQVIQRKQYEEAQQSVKETQKNAAKYANALFHQANDPIAGNPNGSVTVVEFFDYQCPHCVTMGPVISALVKSNANARVIYKEFPIRGPMSELAARAALAANKQGKYLALHHALMGNQQPLSEDVILDLAKKAGLNVAQLKKDMNDAGTEKQLQNNLKLGQDLKLFGTPAFFVGKTDVSKISNIQYFPGEMNKKQLEEAISKA